MRWPGAFFFCALLFCSGAQTLNYYFGNIHAHTGFSDGNKDSASSGIGRPDGSYAYAKLSNDFDFLGISEHNHYSSSHNPGFRRPLYQAGRSMADAADAPGQFLAMFGMEYGVSSQYNGHVLIYGMDKLLGWETSVPGVSGNNYDVYNAKTDYAGLFAKVNATPGAFAYLAHPAFDDYSLDGTWQTSLANAPYNASIDSAVIGMPLRSGLASNPGNTYSDYPEGHYFNYYKKMLYNGYHLGIGYDHDNHYTNFGRGNGGRLVVRAATLTRAGFSEAMKAMRFYGSDDSNARVDLVCNGQPMGSVLGAEGAPSISVTHNDPDGEQADSIKIWKGYKGSGGLWASIVHYNTGNNTLMFTDQDIEAGHEYYYFAEIRQQDGQWIVTSPVWFTPGGILLVRSNAPMQFTQHYDPVMDKLFLSADLAGQHRLKVMDLQGREVITRDFDGSSIGVDLSALPPGIYVVELARGQQRQVKRLVKN
jgi:hypothetical protein